MPRTDRVSGAAKWLHVAESGRTKVETRRRQPAVRCHAKATFLATARRAACGRDEPKLSSSWPSQTSHPRRGPTGEIRSGSPWAACGAPPTFACQIRATAVSLNLPFSSPKCVAVTWALMTASAPAAAENARPCPRRTWGETCMQPAEKRLMRTPPVRTAVHRTRRNHTPWCIQHRACAGSGLTFK